MKPLYQQMRLTVPAGGRDVIEFPGAYVACITSSLSAFRLSTDDGPSSEFRQGFTVRGAFERVVVENPSAVPLTVTLAVGDGAFEDRRLISAAPDSVDPVTLEDIRGRAFLGLADPAAAVGQFSYAQVRNPAGSGKIALVKRLMITATAAAQFYCRTGAALATMRGVTTPAYLGGASGVVEMRQETTAADLGTGTFFIGSVQTSDLLDIAPKTPWVIPAGAGLIVFPAATNVGVVLNAEILEIDG